ncbi:hypothetical protein EYF80_044729 [Liparis tanakae]|uniref:Uncharacterized protein n=1 Tax=Liparis tanakae TaxID=230148 RepID=A0A4Z2FX27_9TELE|nr:hypothetical protein EYF80_044729 [Liparis tanakae]
MGPEGHNLLIRPRSFVETLSPENRHGPVEEQFADVLFLLPGREDQAERQTFALEQKAARSAAAPPAEGPLRWRGTGTSGQGFAPSRTYNIPQRFGGFAIRRLKEPADQKVVGVMKPQKSYMRPLAPPTQAFAAPQRPRDLYQAYVTRQRPSASYKSQGLSGRPQASWPRFGK